MGNHNAPSPTTPLPGAEPTTRQEVARAWLFLRRALRLRCPECGISPMFVPLSRTRSIHDWYAPLDGCPRCGYAYEREKGYFLLAIWGVQYFSVTGAGLALGLILDALLDVSMTTLVCLVTVPTILFGILFVRHAKSIYLAIDHYLDPHVKGERRRGSAR